MVSAPSALGVADVAVVPFEEVTPAGMAPALATELVRLLAASGVRVSARADAASRLDGSIDVNTAPSASRGGVQSYVLAATVRATLTPQGGAARQVAVRVREDFLPVTGVDVQPLLTETRRRLALARLAERAAQAVYEALLMGGMG